MAPSTNLDPNLNSFAMHYGQMLDTPRRVRAEPIKINLSNGDFFTNRTICGPQHAESDKNSRATTANATAVENYTTTTSTRSTTEDAAPTADECTAAVLTNTNGAEHLTAMAFLEIHTNKTTIEKDEKSDSVRNNKTRKTTGSSGGFGFGGRTAKSILSILLLSTCTTGAAAAAAAEAEKASLWERLGGEPVVRPMVSAIYDRHASDPLSKDFFGPHKYDNSGDSDVVKNHVFTFFSSGIGGPHSASGALLSLSANAAVHPSYPSSSSSSSSFSPLTEYEGRSMIEAHKKMNINEPGFHAVAYHVMEQMEVFKAGGATERDEVLNILKSLKADVQSGSSTTEEAANAYDPIAFISSFVHGALDYVGSLPIPKTLGDIKNLGLDDWYSLLPLIIFLASPLIALQFARKVGQAHDLDNNSEGLFQFNKFFYAYPSSIIAALPFLLGLAPGVTAVFGALRGGSWCWLTAVVGYVLVPIVDLILGEDSYNPTADQEAKLKVNIWFRVILWIYPVTYIGTIVLGSWVIATTDPTFWETLGIAVSVGIAGGFGIGCVHESIHRPSKIEVGGGIIATVFANYSHFWIEHLWGHHKRVATDQDPASSNVGDNIYTYWPQVIYKSFVSALDIEARFLERKGLGILSHRILQGYTASAIIAFAVYHFAGPNALWFYLAQGFVVALHIENANFIEHYGLRRRVLEGVTEANGEPIYERPGWFHAWDTGDRLTNWMLFKIQRHPDHHTNAGRPYQILRTFAQSPTMPTGYAGMFVLSWFPPLFHAIMDPLVKRAYRQRELMEAKGVSASAFPKGSNNMSSLWKREGEGYFEKGSSPYDAGAKTNESEVKLWDTQYNEVFAKALATGTGILKESHKLGVDYEETKKSL